jgi:hypothetical protein
LYDQLGKFLLCHSQRRPGKRNWTRQRFAWIRVQRFEHEVQRRVLDDYLTAALSAGERVARLTEQSRSSSSPGSSAGW